MSKEEVNQSIAALHAEIDQLETSDAEVKTKLLSLIETVEKRLQEPEESAHKNTNLNTLSSLIEQFESDHPKMTETLSRLLNTLSSMGV